jgi:hypothetical protein
MVVGKVPTLYSDFGPLRGLIERLLLHVRSGHLGPRTTHRDCPGHLGEWALDVSHVACLRDYQGNAWSLVPAGTRTTSPAV